MIFLRNDNTSLQQRECPPCCFLFKCIFLFPLSEFPLSVLSVTLLFLLFFKTNAYRLSVWSSGSFLFEDSVMFGNKCIILHFQIIMMSLSPSRVRCRNSGITETQKKKNPPRQRNNHPGGTFTDRKKCCLWVSLFVWKVCKG